MRYKIAWSKINKRYDAEPVYVKKSYQYLNDMIQDVIQDLKDGNVVCVPKQPLMIRHVMAPAVKAPREDIIQQRIMLSRFKKKEEDNNNNNSTTIIVP